MRCPSCNTESTGAFCSACGAALINGAKPTPKGPGPLRKRLGCGCLGLLIILGVFAWISGRNDKSTTLPSTPPGQSASTAGVTRANYAQITTGMTYSQVEALLGKPGEEISRVEMGGVTTVMYQWKSGFFGANMNAMFQNGKLISKAQYGL
jgi:Domain of Unknown Function with PDB structure (DUF3862)